jgi:ABC-type glycerol-3-phosphate transport system substrate-binding protein
MVYTIPLPVLGTGTLKLMKKLTTLCLALAFSSCSYHSTTNQQTAPQELVVAAAANLTDAFAEIGPRFTAKTGIRVVFSFGPLSWQNKSRMARHLMFLPLLTLSMSSRWNAKAY